TPRHPLRRRRPQGAPRRAVGPRAGAHDLGLGASFVTGWVHHRIGLAGPSCARHIPTYLCGPMAELRIDVWSDIACPWCYVGKRRLESALKDFPHASEVRVVWHSFELDPSAPKERDASVSHAERIARKYGMTTEQAQKSTDRLAATARGEGLSFDFEHIRS